jgi:TonB family protein
MPETMIETWNRLEGELVDGKFRLERRLGGDEHHAVFLTEFGEKNPRKAAIKLILADATSETRLSSWKAVAELSHPHLVRLLQSGRCRVSGTEFLYAVTERADEDLSQVLTSRPLTPSEAREMLGPVLNALAFLHGKGFVHGHIKPANIMAVDDQVKISSDGLWRMAESGGTLGKAGPYDPPEATGGRISPAGDVWSLGMTLVEVLTQRLPAWERTEQGEPALPPSLPAEFIDLARRCLRRDPQLRWTVPDVSERLKQSSSVPRERTTERLQARSSKLGYIIVPAIALVLAAFLLGPRVVRRQSGIRQAPPALTERPATPAKSDQPKPDRAAASSATTKPTQKSGEMQAASGPASSPATTSNEVKIQPRGPSKGGVVRQVLPEIPQKASDTIRGTVRVSVRVSVDALGSVADATLNSPGPSKYFADKSLQAARGWKFQPAKANGQQVASEWVLRFEFQQAGTTVHPVELTP